MFGWFRWHTHAPGEYKTILQVLGLLLAERPIHIQVHVCVYSNWSSSFAWPDVCVLETAQCMVGMRIRLVAAHMPGMQHKNLRERSHDFHGPIICLSWFPSKIVLLPLVAVHLFNKHTRLAIQKASDPNPYINDPNESFLLSAPPPPTPLPIQKRLSCSM